MARLHVTIHDTDLSTGEGIYQKADNYMFIGRYTSYKFCMHLYSHSLLMIYTLCILDTHYHIMLYVHIAGTDCSSCTCVFLMYLIVVCVFCYRNAEGKLVYLLTVFFIVAGYNIFFIFILFAHIFMPQVNVYTD